MAPECVARNADNTLPRECRDADPARLILRADGRWADGVLVAEDRGMTDDPAPAARNRDPASGANRREAEDRRVALSDAHDPAPVSSTTGGTANGGPVTVRYWAAARAARGCESESRPAGSVAAILDAVLADHPDLGPILRVASVLLDGQAVDRTANVPAGAVLEVLPPFAGG